MSLYNPAEQALKTLTFEDLKQLPLKNLDDWQSIGYQLGVPQGKLTSIVSRYSDRETCRRMIMGEVSRLDKPPTVRDLVSALLKLKKEDTAKRVCQDRGWLVLH